MEEEYGDGAYSDLLCPIEKIFSEDVKEYTDVAMINLGHTYFQLELLKSYKKTFDSLPMTMMIENDTISVATKEAITKEGPNSFYFPLFYLNQPVPEVVKPYLRYEINGDFSKHPTFIFNFRKDHQINVGAETLLALILERAIEDRSKYKTLGDNTKKACVCAIPALMTGTQRATLKEIFKALNFTEVNFISDIAAACIGSKAFTSSKKGKRNVLIVNFGFSLGLGIASVGNEMIKIECYKEIDISKFNGAILDTILYKIVKEKNAEKFDEKVLDMKLFNECEESKKYLSYNNSCYVGPHKITIDKYNYKADSFYSDFENELDEFIEEQKINAEEMEIIIIGGQMNNPTLKEKVEGLKANSSSNPSTNINSNPSTIIMENIYKEADIIECWDKDEEATCNAEEISEKMHIISSLAVRPPPEEFTKGFQKLQSRDKTVINQIDKVAMKYFATVMTKILNEVIDIDSIKNEFLPDQVKIIKDSFFKETLWYDRKQIAKEANDTALELFKVHRSASNRIILPYNIKRIEEYCEVKITISNKYDPYYPEDHGAGYEADDRSPRYRDRREDHFHEIVKYVIEPSRPEKRPDFSEYHPDDHKGSHEEYDVPDHESPSSIPAFFSFSDEVFAFITNPGNGDFASVIFDYEGKDKYTIIIASSKQSRTLKINKVPEGTIKLVVACSHGIIEVTAINGKGEKTTWNF